MKITEETLVSDVAASLPSSVRVFRRVGIDVCCGGNKPLAEACDDHRLSFAAITHEIEASADAWPIDHGDWMRATLTELADHIVATYHAKLRKEMPEVETMAASARRVHGDKAPRLFGRIEEIVLELSAGLNEHMREEELVLFPAIRAMEGGESVERAIPISSLIEVKNREHDEAGALLAELRALTNVFAPPEWASPSCQALYGRLAELERDLHVHLHLENSILFPGALRRAIPGMRAH